MRGPDTKTTNRARSLRKVENNAEFKLWNLLRNRQVGDLKFVRQLPIGPYFADFACREIRLVIEIDGSQHVDNPRDDSRNRFMNDNGWSVARFWQADVMRDVAPVLETIAAIGEGRIADVVQSPEFCYLPSMQGRSPSPQPSPRERGEGDSFMRRAIALARPGTTWPNPAVGCVIIKGGTIIGEGFTGSGGRPHAEEMALEQAGDAAQGATAYVTLEPCGQRSTGGLSCSEKLVAAGVAKVIFACPDPSPFAAHTGVVRLQTAGIEVEAGLLNGEAFHLIAGFVHFLETGRPRIAESEDGIGFDAEYQPDPCISYEEGLAALGLKGYRNLYVRPGTEVAHALRELGYLSV